MKLDFAPRARREIGRALDWWAENRPDAPNMLSDELGEYFDKLKATPHLGTPWG